ncbi:MAG TPA: hypothetical protein PLI57_05095 [Spirochaetota bacterium]|nr:hypothetical protein [Spirochaetota bacterium]
MKYKKRIIDASIFFRGAARSICVNFYREAPRRICVNPQKTDEILTKYISDDL